mmetsp:Transcript_41711/g.65276  ORF Transcript_41711/g.65276 Transcript_41711/m.65276 type:complete len:153 (+) Transcript_41711:403-861(+)
MQIIIFLLEEVSRKVERSCKLQHPQHPQMHCLSSTHRSTMQPLEQWVHLKSRRCTTNLGRQTLLLLILLCTPIAPRARARQNSNDEGSNQLQKKTSNDDGYFLPCYGLPLYYGENITLSTLNTSREVAKNMYSMLLFLFYFDFFSCCDSLSF